MRSIDRRAFGRPDNSAHWRAFGNDAAIGDFNFAHTAARAFIRAMPDGVYRTETYLDNDRSGGEEPVPIIVKVIVDGASYTLEDPGQGGASGGESWVERVKEHELYYYRKIQERLLKAISYSATEK